MTYERQVPGDLDYEFCRYGSSRIRFRGPKPPDGVPYMAFLGADETFGRFVPTPYPALITQDLGVPGVNLAIPHAGPDLYLRDPSVLRVAEAARLKVVQVVGAQNMSNRFYRVHPRHNDRFLRASDGLRRLYHEIDFTEFHFVTHMLGTLQETCADRFSLVQDELTSAWRARVGQLIDMIGPPVVLVWIAAHCPRRVDGIVTGRGPALVSHDMVEEIRQHATAYAESCITGEALSLGTEGMVYPADKEPLARLCSGPAVHVKVAKDLVPTIQKCLEDD